MCTLTVLAKTIKDDVQIFAIASEDLECQAINATERKSVGRFQKRQKIRGWCLKPLQLYNTLAS